jgi:hypothetical protein
MSEVWAAAAVAVVGAGASYGLNQLGAAKAPATAQYQNVDPTTVQQNAIAGDLNTLPQANQLAGAANSTDLMQAISNMNTALPGFSGLQQSLVGQASGMAANPYALPQQAIGQILQTGAENNISGGEGAASGFSSNNSLRSLGVNVLQYGQQNFQNAMGALSTLTGTAPNVSPVSPLSFMRTPQNALSAVTNNNTQNQAIAQGANNAAAAAGNYNSANLYDSLASSGAVNGLTSAVGAYLGTGPQGSGPSNGGYVSIGQPISPVTGQTVCWVAREVFGETNPKWRNFRQWLLTKAPIWFRNLYIRHGEAFAAWLHRHPAMKPPIRLWMESRIA